MNKKDFHFDLPEHLIAQTPLENRTSSRLMVLNKDTGETKDEEFKNLIEYLNEGDTLILNNSRVLPARIFGIKDTGAKVEFLLLEEVEKDTWNVLVKPGKRARIGAKFTFGDNLLRGEVIGYADQGIRVVKFSDYEGYFVEVLEKIGTMPLPPYIHEELKNQERYQTVYSKTNGSSAAPTAGLHFTSEYIEKLKEKGINVGYVTLHVGLGTFRPVEVDNILDHQMHSEYYELDEDTANMINETKKRGNKVFAVGTTSTRTLESVFKKNGKIVADNGETEIFIYPGKKLNVIDGLITNFHLPESTLIMLVSALSTREFVLNAYNEAIKLEYRFFSFGDAMLIK
ncbi:tRNA preQ1(34) S-adenosylmethionine ribosyltransferase-isomerase QueA [Clostridiaceae bacterium HSG29]|nr:tRNA preQ1(34) S-adenosylmethionine ribosyltransferase-isomerase QueA [Clostridiaceae bacterium HSG29]